ncbi:hypothetical protein ACOME3_001932 [Neoechinorhynchus agilis]
MALIGSIEGICPREREFFRSIKEGALELWSLFGRTISWETNKDDNRPGTPGLNVNRLVTVSYPEESKALLKSMNLAVYCVFTRAFVFLTLLSSDDSFCEMRLFRSLTHKHCKRIMPDELRAKSPNSSLNGMMRLPFKILKRPRPPPPGSQPTVPVPEEIRNIKTFEQRQREYDEARLRIMGKTEEEDSRINQKNLK